MLIYDDLTFRRSGRWTADLREEGGEEFWDRGKETERVSPTVGTVKRAERTDGRNDGQI